MSKNAPYFGMTIKYSKHIKLTTSLIEKFINLL